MELKSRVALITGASGGIGSAVARALSVEQMCLTITARQSDQLSSLAQNINISGTKAIAISADVTDERQVEGLFARSMDHWGRLDVLVNAAGIGRMAPLLHGPADAWREMWEVNVHGLAVATREACKYFRSELGGHIVHISSMASHRPPRTGGFYGATKWAVRALTEGLRFELRRSESHTRVTAISPAYVDTSFFRDYFLGDEMKAKALLAESDVIKPEDVATAVVYALKAPAHVEVHEILLSPSRCTL